MSKLSSGKSLDFLVDKLSDLVVVVDNNNRRGMAFEFPNGIVLDFNGEEYDKLMETNVKEIWSDFIYLDGWLYE